MYIFHMHNYSFPRIFQMQGSGGRSNALPLTWAAAAPPRNPSIPRCGYPKKPQLVCVCVTERCCVILSMLHSGSSHKTDTFASSALYQLVADQAIVAGSFFYFYALSINEISPVSCSVALSPPQSLSPPPPTPLSPACSLSIWKPKEDSDHCSSILSKQLGLSGGLCWWLLASVDLRQRGKKRVEIEADPSSPMLRGWSRCAPCNCGVLLARLL